MPKKEKTFHELLSELEAITEMLEKPDVDLDEGLKEFERGLELSSELKQRLNTLDQKIEKVKTRFENAESE